MTYQDAVKAAKKMRDGDQCVGIVVIDESLLNRGHTEKFAYRAVSDADFDRDQYCGEFYTFVEEYT